MIGEALLLKENKRSINFYYQRLKIAPSKEKPQPIKFDLRATDRVSSSSCTSEDLEE